MGRRRNQVWRKRAEAFKASRVLSGVTGQLLRDRLLRLFGQHPRWMRAQAAARRA